MNNDKQNDEVTWSGKRRGPYQFLRGGASIDAFDILDALNATPTPPASSEPALGELIKIAAELLGTGWASDDPEDWELSISPAEDAVWRAAKDKERRRLMAIQLRSIWDRAKGAEGLDKEKLLSWLDEKERITASEAAKHSRVTNYHKQCYAENSAYQNVMLRVRIGDFDKQGGAQCPTPD